MEMIALHKLPVLDFIFNRGFKNRSLYTDQKEIVDELKKRGDLITDETKLLQAIKPTPSIEPLLKESHLVFFRQVATPLHETIKIIQLAKELGLKLCILEYEMDKLVSAHNFYKLGLGKLPVYKFTDKTGRDVYQNHTIIDFNTYAGKPFRDVYTLRGERLIDFHHDFLKHITGVDAKDVVIDASDWFSQFNNHANEYYEAFFTLFVKRNVLAEVFMLDGDVSELNFTKGIANPAFKLVTEKQGFKPLILNYQPRDEQARVYWDCYPEQANDFLRKKGYIE